MCSAAQTVALFQCYPSSCSDKYGSHLTEMIATQTHDRWVTYPRANPAADIRLFCLPHAGGGASAYHTWLSALPSFVELCPIQMPGRENRIRERLFTSLPPLVSAIAESLSPHLDKPFAFFGHSMGAKLLFELARLLRREHGPEPLHLFISGHGAPHIQSTEPPIHTLPDAEFIREVQRYEGMPQEILESEELMRYILPILRADFSINETYVYAEEPPLSSPITAYGGLRDEGAPRADMEAWREHTTASFELQMFPGGHFFLQTERRLVLQELSYRLFRLKEKLS